MAPINIRATPNAAILPTACLSVAMPQTMRDYPATGCAPALLPEKQAGIAGAQAVPVRFSGNWADLLGDNQPNSAKIARRTGASSWSRLITQSQSICGP